MDGLYQYIDPKGQQLNPRILLPKEVRAEVMELIHNLGHFGGKRTFNTIKKYYIWPGMRRDVGHLVQHYINYQRNKKTRVPK